MRIGPGLHITQPLRVGLYGYLQSVLGGDTLGIVMPTTVFSDTSGTTPQATFGGVVRALRSQSGALFGVQTTAGQEPLFARHPDAGLRNILPANSTNLTSGAGWATLRAGRADAVNSATGEPATLLTATETSVNGGYLQATTITLAAGTYTVSSIVKGSAFAMWQVVESTVTANFARAWINATTGVLGSAIVNGAATTITAITHARTAVGDGWRHAVTFTLNATTTIFLRQFIADANAGFAVTLGATLRVEAPQFEAGASATGYQRRVSASDVTETGRRSVNYLFGDGIGDALPFTLPAGTYTVARMSRTGYSFTENVVHAGGAFDLLSGTGRDYAVLLHNEAGGLLSAAEKSVLQSVFEYAGEGATV
jgi:hypothetical protein